jgi:hypothetical protein
MKRLAVLLLSCVLLCSCATKPNGDLADTVCRPDFHGGSGSDPLADLAAILIVDLTWFAGCEAVVGIANGIHHFRLAYSHDGVYYSPDGAFSIGVPMAASDEYLAQQQTSASKDTVVFVPRRPGEPVYGVTVLTHLEGSQAELSLADFSSRADADLSGIGVPVTQIHAEDTQLGGNPARLVVYRSTTPVDRGAQSNFYLTYFVKTGHSAAILSITWPYECPRCTAGPDATLRDMDGVLDSFLGSFELANQSR